METETQEYSRKVYKKDSKGKIRFLHVYTDGAEVIQLSGLLDSEKAVEHRSTSVGKNIGKSNETTPEQQSQLEAASKVENKMTTGYFDTIIEAETEEIVLPMLAKEYGKHIAKVEFPCYAQPKLDGMRALGGSDLVSRKGKKITTMHHIQEEINRIPIIDLLDGELYAHGKTFQENMKLIKKYRPGQTETVKYHVYDLVLPNESFKDRYALLSVMVKGCKNIELVETVVINNHEELEAYHQTNLKRRFEGTIVRWGEAGYAVNKRSSNLLKFKDFLDIACLVIDIVPSKKRPEQGVCVCRMPYTDAKAPGAIFHTGMKFSHKEREEILTNKGVYVGQTAEIRFFEYTDDGLPRFPVCVGFRLDV